MYIIYITYYLLIFIYYLLFIIYYLLFIIYYLFFIIYFLLFIIYFLLFIIYFLFFIFYFLFFINFYITGFLFDQGPNADGTIPGGNPFWGGGGNKDIFIKSTVYLNLFVFAVLSFFFLVPFSLFSSFRTFIYIINLCNQGYKCRNMCVWSITDLSHHSGTYAGNFRLLSINFFSTFSFI